MKKDIKAASSIKNADDLIIANENSKLGKAIPESKTQSEPQEEQAKPQLEEESNSIPEEPSPYEESEKQKEEQEGTQDQEKEHEAEEGNDASDEASEDEVDEYGTKVTSGKKKLYTDEEVQRMIRERLSRGKHQEQAPEVQKAAAKDFTPDPESDESWETQLESFVENTLEKLSKKAIAQEWKVRDERNQAEFETKFSNGMTKYKDFADVVSNKPITNAMMMATRSMSDPAAFMYAACKTQAKELSRIAQIDDAVTQAAEIGRLEERMKKARSLSSSPKPASKISGDSSSELPQLDIDARINQHAKSKIMR